jgi:TP901 family phage tail tape measure protein
VADIPPIMVELSGNATSFLRMMTNATKRLTAFRDAFTSVAEGATTALAEIEANVTTMAESVTASATEATDSLAGLDESTRGVGLGFSTMGEDIVASMQAAAAEIAAGAGEIRAALTEMGDQVKVTAAESSAAAEGMGEKFLGLGEIGGMLKAALPLSIAAIGYESVKAATTFQGSTTRLVTSAGEIQSNLNMVRSGMLSMAGQVGVSANDLSQAMYYVEAAGFHGADGLTALKAAAQGAAAEGADTTDVAKALTDVLKDYHLNASASADVTSQMITAVAHGKVTLEDFSKAFASIVPAASAAGISFNDVGSALAEMTNHGFTAQRASQNLAQALRSLLNPTKPMSDAFKEWGVSADELKAKLHGPNGLTDAMEYLSQAASKAGKEGTPEYAAALKNLMGTAAGANAALATVGQNFSDTSATIKAMGSATQDAQGRVQGFALVQETLGQQLRQIRDGFDAVMIRIGDGLIPLLSKLIPMVEGGLTPVFKGLGSAISGIASGFSGPKPAAPPSRGVGRVARLQEGAGDATAPPAQLTAWQQVGQMLHGVAKDFETFASDAGAALRNLATAAQPVLQVLGGAFMLALVAVGKILANVVGPALQGFADFLAHHQGLIKFFAEVILGGLATKLAVIGTIKAGTSIIDLGTKILGFPLKSVSGISDAFNGLKTAVKNAAKTAGDIRDAFMKVPWGKIGSGISSAFSSTWSLIVKGAQGAAGLAVKAWQGAQDAMVTIAGKAGQAWRGAQDLLVSGAGKVGQAWRGLQSVGSSVMSGISDAASTAWSNIQSGASAAASAASSAWQGFVGLASQVGGAAKNAALNLLDLSKAALAGGLNALRAAAAWVAEKVALLASAAAEKAAAAAEWLLNLAMDANPLMLVVLAVIAIIAILVLCYEKVGWFRDFVNAAFKAVSVIALWLWRNVFEPAFKGIAQLATWLWNNVIKPAAEGIGSAFTGLAHGAQAAFKWIISAGQGAASWLAALPGKILGWFADAGKWLWNAGVSIIEGLWNGIQSMGSWIASNVMGFIKSVVPGPVLSILGIHSPSRVFHEIGVNVSKGLANGILSGNQMVGQASTGLALSTVRGFGNPAVALGVSGGRQLAMASAGYGTPAAAGAGSSVVNINVAGTVVAERQLRDLVEKLNLQRGGRNSQTYQSAKK